MLKQGMKIRLIEMVGEKDPIPPGTTGTVHDVVKVADSDVAHVTWENGRALNLVVPPDRFEVVSCLSAPAPGK